MKKIYPFIEKECECGELFMVTTNVAWKTVYCLPCRQEKKKKRNREYARGARRGYPRKKKERSGASYFQNEYAYYKIVEDPGECPYSKGAQFSLYEIREMLRMGSINEGTLLMKHSNERVRVSKQKLVKV